MACTLTSEDNLPAIQSKNFSYGIDTGFTCSGFSRVPLPELQKWFTPEPGKPFEEWRTFRQMPKKKAAAQVVLYGGRSYRKRAKYQLWDMIQNGGCDAPSEMILKIEMELKAKYDEKNAAHQAKIASTRQAEFDQTKNPTQAANCSIPLFLRRYFINEDETPNPLKTIELMILRNLTNPESVCSAASKVPGLYACIRGPESKSYCLLVIGWDESRVLSEARKEGEAAWERKRMDEKEEEEKKMRKREEAREKRMNRHRNFVRELLATKGAHAATSKQGDKKFEIDDIAGTYLVECDQIAREWPEASEHGLFLTISRDKDHLGRFVGKFEFGPLEGIMRFRQVGEEPLPDKDEDEVEVEEEGEEEGEEEEEEEEEEKKEKKKEEEKNEEGQMEVEDEDDEEEAEINDKEKKEEKEEVDGMEEEKGQKQRQEEEQEGMNQGDMSEGSDTSPVSTSLSLKRKRMGPMTRSRSYTILQKDLQQRALKKPRLSSIFFSDSTDSAFKLKLLFHWRGELSGLGDNQEDEDNLNRGFIELDKTNDCTTFTGMMSAKLFGDEPVHLKGYKYEAGDWDIGCTWEDYEIDNECYR